MPVTQNQQSPVIIFGALADASRCRIVEMLLAKPQPVHRLSEAFAISRPAISRHLRVLREAGLVRERKQGRENIYELQPEALEAARDWFARVGPAKAASKVRAAKPASTKPAPAKPALAEQMAFDL